MKTQVLGAVVLGALVGLLIVAWVNKPTLRFDPEETLKFLQVGTRR